MHGMADALRELTRDECLDRVRAGRIGRVAVTHRALPAILPVNYVFDRGIVFRTRSNSMLANACRGAVVAFEIDELAEDGTSGWSVLVVGVADALEGSDRLRAINRGLASALGEPTDHFVRISLGTMTGREICRPVVGTLQDA
jgi:nitroimidazol reductase NimA-like FMN-containing flavoprotein (pyridoxamine 5'-phosphate oxidase superfamily)